MSWWRRLRDAWNDFYLLPPTEPYVPPPPVHGSIADILSRKPRPHRWCPYAQWGWMLTLFLVGMLLWMTTVVFHDLRVVLQQDRLNLEGLHQRVLALEALPHPIPERQKWTKPRWWAR